jgi:hypothetical protein
MITHFLLKDDDNIIWDIGPKTMGPIASKCNFTMKQEAVA